MRDRVMKARLPCPLVAVGGPSGIGKTSAINYLVRRYPNEYARPLSYTSRAPRPDEDGREYLHVSDEEMRAMWQAGALANLDDAYGKLYGISTESIDTLGSSGVYPIKEVHPANHAKLRQLHPGLVSVIMLPFDANDLNLMTVGAREDRKTADAEFYSHIDLSQFDVIRPICAVESLEVVSEFLRGCIRATHATRALFPAPGMIDAVNRAGYDQVACEFSETRRVTTANFHLLSKAFFHSLIAETLIEGWTCLEVGPGWGWLRNEFRWPNVAYLGVDISPGMAHRSSEDGGVAVVQVGSARNLPLASSSVDAILASLADPFCYPAALCEMRRVMRPGGLFAMSAPARHWSDGIRDSDNSHYTVFGLNDGQQARVCSFTFSLTELCTLLELCGFEIARCATATGADLPSDARVAPAIALSAERQRVPLNDLAILNMVVARRAEK